MKQNIENLIALLSAQEECARAVARGFRNKKEPDEEMAKKYDERALTYYEVLSLLKDKKFFNDIAEIFLTNKHDPRRAFIIKRKDTYQFLSVGDGTTVWVDREEAYKYTNYEIASNARRNIVKMFKIPLDYLEIVTIDD